VCTRARECLSTDHVTVGIREFRENLAAYLPEDENSLNGIGSAQERSSPILSFYFSPSALLVRWRGAEATSATSVVPAWTAASAWSMVATEPPCFRANSAR